MMRPAIEMTCIIIYHEHAFFFVCIYDIFPKLLNHVLETKWNTFFVSMTYITDIKRRNKLSKDVCVEVVNKNCYRGDTGTMVLSPLKRQKIESNVVIKIREKNIMKIHTVCCFHITKWALLFLTFYWLTNQYVIIISYYVTFVPLNMSIITKRLCTSLFLRQSESNLSCLCLHKTTQQYLNQRYYIGVYVTKGMFPA